MIIREAEMSAGSYSFSLSGTTPSTVIKAVRESVSTNPRNGYVCMFNTAVKTPSLAAATRTFHLTVQNGPNGFSGVGLPALLQSNADLGQHVTTNTTVLGDTAYTLTQWFDEFLPWNGLTKGTINMTGLSSITSFWLAGLGAVEMMNAVCAKAGGAVWRCNTDGSFDAGLRANVFTTTPEFIVSPRRRTLGASGLKVINGGVTNYQVDASQLSDQTIAYGQEVPHSIGFEVATSSAADPAVAIGIDGVAASIKRPLEAPDGSGTELQTLADANGAMFTAPSTSYRVATSDPEVLRSVVCGDAIWLDDPLIDGDTSITYGKSTIKATKAYVHSMDAESYDGQGFWFYRPNEAAADQWIDLTRYMLTGNGSAVLVMSNGAGPSDTSLIWGFDRFRVERPNVSFNWRDLWASRIGNRTGNQGNSVVFHGGSAASGRGI